MTDWRKLPAGRELDRLIAERIGWRFEKVSPYHWEVYRPDGSPVEQARGYTYINQWEDSHLMVTGMAFPRYSTDMNAALTLPLPGLFDEYRFELSGCNDKWIACVHYRHAIDLTLHSPIIGTPALAVCRAWLDWRERQRADALTKTPPREE